MIRTGTSQLRFLVVLAMVLGAVLIIRGMVVKRRQAHVDDAADTVTVVVRYLNQRNGQGLQGLLAEGHRQGDPAALIAARDRIGPIANYSDSGTVELNINGVQSERRMYTLEGARANGSLELDLLRDHGRWELIGIRLDDAQLPTPQPVPQGAPTPGGAIQL